ncbi:MAG: DUF4252 domain-containing protein [Alistipes sp.]|nr:DUF4252 domain-containing protein [Alistipes sp.]
MKRLIILLIMLLPLSVMAQSPDVESIVKEYSSKEKCTTINISNAMLRSMEVDIDAEYMQVVAVEDEKLAPTFRTQVQELLKECDIIMSVNREGKIVEVYQHANQRGEVVDIYILACDEGKSIMMHITGTNLKLNNIGSLMNTL